MICKVRIVSPVSGGKPLVVTAAALSLGMERRGLRDNKGLSAW